MSINVIGHDLGMKKVKEFLAVKVPLVEITFLNLIISSIFLILFFNSKQEIPWAVRPSYVVSLHLLECLQVFLS